jgi:hypothetical protein
VSTQKENKQVRGRTKAIAVIGAALTTALVAAGPLAAASPTFTAATGSVSCTIVGKGSFTDEHGAKTALKNDWKKADHQADPGSTAVAAAVAALPDTRFSPDGPITITAKFRAACTGSATGEGHTAQVTGATIVTTAVSSGDPGSPSQCGDILLGGAVSNSTVTWKASKAKINPTTITGDDLTPLIDSHGIGFNLQSGAVTGSFAGGTDMTNAYLDAVSGPSVLNGIIGPKVDSSNASTIKTANPCEPSLKVKAPKNPPDVATIKGGKGIKKIGVGAAGAGLTPMAPAGGDGHSSSFTLSAP